MPNTDFVYNSGASGLFIGGFNLSSNTINAVLVKNTYAPVALATAQKNYRTLADILTYEATGTGYTSSGVSLSGKTVWQDDYATLSIFDSTDPSWASSTITASGVALCKLGTLANGSDSPLLDFYSFGGDVSSTNGTFTIVVNASGWLQVGP